MNDPRDEVPWPDEPPDCWRARDVEDGNPFAGVRFAEVSEEQTRQAEQRAEELRDKARARVEDVDADGQGFPAWVSFEEIEETPVSWLWDGWLPASGIVLLEAGVNAGKSTVLADWCARISQGLAFPGCSGTTDPRDVLWLTCEERLAFVKGRLRVAEAERSRVHTPERMGAIDLSGGPGLSFLREGIERFKPALVVVDGFKSFLGAIKDADDTEVRRAMSGLVELSHELEVCVVATRHWRKSGGLALERGGGSIAFAAMAEAVIGLGTKNDHRWVAQAKNRCGPVLGHAWGFDIEPVDGSARALWLPKPEMVSANELSMADLHTKAALAKPVASKLEQAKTAIVDVLRKGPRIPAEVVEVVAEKVGCSERTVQKAAKEIDLPDGRSVKEWRLA